MDARKTRNHMPTARAVTVQARIESQVRRAPTATAIEFEGRTISYEDLDLQAECLARRLRRLGVGPDVIVGLCATRSIEMVVGMLGILKAGGAYLPLDPGFPDDRLSYMVEDSAAPVLLTNAATREMLRESRAVRVDLDELRASASWDEPVEASAECAASSLAVVIYTSGSTGRPKGVMISHGAMVNFLTSMAVEPGMRADDVSAAITTLSFDIAAFELLLPLTVGARIALISREVVIDAERLRRALVDTKATVVQATPSTWRMLLAAGWTDAPRPRLAITGGEPLTRALADSLLPRVGALWNLYGPTETTVWSTQMRIEAGDGPISIGLPIANTTTRIVDDQLRPVVDGEAGELLIGGDGLARGYLNRPELTAEKFIHFESNELGAPPERLYRTGDLARLLPDGRLECLGRIDHQVKIRGFRIELGEMETALVAIPNIREAVVVARDDAGDGQKRLVAYVIAHQSPAPNVSELRRLLDAQLPDYMVPSSFAEVSEWPLTPNGKIDRKALPPPPDARPNLEVPFVPPCDAVELRLQRIWQDVRAVHPIGTHDNFFDLGGDSVSAVDLQVRMEREFGRPVATAVLVEHGTMRAVAEFLRTENDSSCTDLIVTLQHEGSKAPLFLIHALGGMVPLYSGFARRFAPDRPVHGIQAVGLQDGCKPLATIEDMARRYVAEIRARQPFGPYFIGGWSFGALVAVELARQLTELGERVAFLAILDEEAPGVLAYTWRNPAVFAVSTARGVFWILTAPFAGRGREAATMIVSKLRAARRALLGLVQKDVVVAYEAKYYSERFSEFMEVGDSMRTLLDAHVRASHAYKPARSNASAFVYRTRLQRLFRPDRADHGWSTYFKGKVKTRYVHGDHTSMFEEEHVDSLATQVRKDIDAVEAALRRSPQIHST